MSDINKMDIRRLDGSLLLIFQALMQHRNASKVATELNMSQSTVSHALARLRVLFDDPLFIRRSHGMAPTKRAIELEPQVEAMLLMASTMLGGERRFEPFESTRTFRISAPEFVTVLIGAHLINSFSEQAPNATLTILHLTENVAFDALRRGELDVAIGRYTNLPLESTGLVSELLYEDHYCAVVRRDHPDMDALLTAADYFDRPHVFAYAQSEFTSAEIQQDYSAFNVQAHVPYWLTALTLASTTNAIATCPARFAKRLVDTLNLQILGTSTEPMSISTVRRADDRDGSKGWLLDQLKQAIKVN